MLLYRYCFVLLCISKYKPPGVYIQRGDLTDGFLCYGFGGLYLEVLIHGMAYFRNFTVITTLLRPKLSQIGITLALSKLVSVLPRL